MKRIKKKRNLRLLLCLCILCSLLQSTQIAYATESDGEIKDEAAMENEENVSKINTETVLEISSEKKAEVVNDTVEKETVELKETDSNSKSHEEKKDTKDNKEEKNIPVKEIDLGDYQSEMIIGERQLLVCTVIPEDSTNQEIKYRSSNTSVASVNGLGRINANAAGETTIYASCGDVTNSFNLKVKKADDDKVAVKDIEISDYEEKIVVGETMTITAKILPIYATETNITYKSENSAIATVNSSGEVKGIKKGDVTILVSAGGITKRVNLKVVVNTKRISVNNDYLVLKPGSNSQITAKVYPEDSPQDIKFKSMDSAVAEVTSDGVVTAKKVGNTCIVVSNGDNSISITVIVNNSGRASKKSSGDDTDEIVGEGEDDIYCSGFIDPKTCVMLSKEMLKYLYENKKSTTVMGEGYSIRVDGDKILNYANELSTEIDLVKKKGGNFEFVVNEGKNICGEIFLSFDTTKNRNLEGKKLYLYNESKKKYEQIQYDSLNNISITKAGKYLFSDGEKIHINAYKFYLICGISILLLLTGCFVVVKKKYWFW